MLKLSTLAIPLLLSAPAILPGQAIGDRPHTSMEEMLAAIDKPLYSKCDPVGASVHVDLLDGDLGIGETLEALLENKAEAALRKGGIWTDEKRLGPFLVITANRGGSPGEPLDAVSLSVAFVKPAADDYGTRFLATAWTGHQSAVPFDRGDLMLDVLLRSIDAFVIKYLKTNATECSRAE